MKVQEGQASFKVSLSLSFLIIISILIAFLAFTWHDANAITTIGITLSRSCQLSDNCKSIDYMAFDNTNQLFSGFLEYNDKGVIERQPSPYKKHWNFYQYGGKHSVIIAVDPDPKWIPNLSKHIMVEPSQFTYFEAGDFTVKPTSNTYTIEKKKQICPEYQNPKCWEIEIIHGETQGDPQRTQRVNQYIDSCGFARVHYDALKDTINHFLQNCPKGDSPYIENIIMPQVPFHYKDTQWAKYADWLSSAKQKCKVKC